MKKLIVIIVIIIVGLSATLYFGIWHEPVEKIDKLIGQNYEYASEKYFRTEPDNQYVVNINKNLSEFDGGILNQKEILEDSIVHVFTWEFENYKKTIWVGDTKNMKSQIIDAIRYKDNVIF